MSEIGVLAGALLPVFLAMAGGYIVRKAGVLTAEADHSLIGLVVTLLSPCLALDTIIGNEALLKPGNIVLPPLFGFGSVLIGVAVARLAARLFCIHGERERRTFHFAACVQNYGYIAIPLCLALFDRETLGVLFAFILGVEIAFWSVAVLQLTGPASAGWQGAINPPIIAIFVSLILNALGADRWIPKPIDATFHLLGNCAIPLGLLLTGALVADYLNPSAFRHCGRTLAAGAFTRLLVTPLLLLAIAVFLPLSHSLKAVLVIQAAMPAAMLPIALTRVHNGHVPTALQVVLGTTLLGLLTIPLWISLGLWWAGG